MRLGDLNVYEGLYQKRRYDPISLAMLANHNVYVYLKAFDMANAAAFGAQGSAEVPRLYRQCIEVIGKAFDRPDWAAFLYREKSILGAHSQ
jgi:hypothetical protein